MRTELKLIDVTAQSLRRLIRIKRDQIAWLCVTQYAGGRCRIGVADKENRMLRIFDHTTRKNIGERLRRHHPAGKRVDAARFRRRLRDRLTIENEWLDLFE